MIRVFLLLTVFIIGVEGCRPKSIPETRSGRKKSESINKKQYEMHPSYKKKKRKK